MTLPVRQDERLSLEKLHQSVPRWAAAVRGWVVGAGAEGDLHSPQPSRELGLGSGHRCALREVPDSTMGRERQWGVCRPFHGSPRGFCSRLLGGTRDGRGTAPEERTALGLKYSHREVLGEKGWKGNVQDSRVLFSSFQEVSHIAGSRR